MRPPLSEERRGILLAVVERLPRADRLSRNVFVGIDGVDGSCKTVFADELAREIGAIQPVVRISIDGFHRQRAERYRLGRDSPEGFWLDSYDYNVFRRRVVTPLRGGNGPYLDASHDLDTDELLDGPGRFVDGPSVILVDGIFLHRPELRDVWDFSIFLDVDFTVSVPRMAVRDGGHPDPEDARNRRYVAAQRFYLREHDPRGVADLIIDNNDVARPRIARDAPTTPQ